MTDSAQGEQKDRSGRLSAFFRNIRRHNRQVAPRPSFKAEASPARGVASSNPPTTSQRIKAATDSGITSTILNTATGATGFPGATDTPIGSQIDAVEEEVEIDLWSRAYRRLDEKTKKWIEDASKKESGEEKAQDLIRIVRKREEVYKEETPKLKVGDQEILWRDYANRVVAWVTAIGDISSSFAPAPSLAAWSAVKVLLKVRSYTQGELRKQEILRTTRNGSIIEHSANLLSFWPLLLFLTLFLFSS
jgi:hypothetical protein